MADHLTEEEQIEAIKKWWQDNWLSVVLPIVLLISAYTGWNYWSDYKQQQSEEASDKYQLMLADLEGGAALSAEQKATVLAKAIDIQAHYTGTFYADASALVLAKYAVEDNELDKAEALLQGVVDKPSNESIALLAKARLARVLLANGKSDEALSLVSGQIPEGSKVLYAEIRGDIYVVKEELEAANTAYQEALDSLDQSQMSRFGILQLKLSSTQTAPAADESDAESDSVAKG